MPKTQARSFGHLRHLPRKTPIQGRVETYAYAILSRNLRAFLGATGYAKHPLAVPLSAGASVLCRDIAAHDRAPIQQSVCGLIQATEGVMNLRVSNCGNWRLRRNRR